MPPIMLIPIMSDRGFQLSVGSTMLMISRPSIIMPIVGGMVSI